MANNLAFNGNAGDPSATNECCSFGTKITTANGNVLGADPLFANPAASDFTLRAGSLAIGKGTTAYGTPYNDLAGNRRGLPLDIGAYTHWVCQGICAARCRLSESLHGAAG